MPFFTSQQENEIYPIIDRALELPIGKAVLHSCTLRRANYLARLIKGLRYDTAVESILIYDKSSPLYGKGSYAYLWAEPHDKGLLVTSLASPHEDDMWRIIRCAAYQKSVGLAGNYGTNHQRLIRVQKKYPEIMGKLWLTTDGIIQINYAQVGREELIIVDIDTNPHEPMKDATNEEIAKAG